MQQGCTAEVVSETVKPIPRLTMLATCCWQALLKLLLELKACEHLKSPIQTEYQHLKYFASQIEYLTFKNLILKPAK